MTQDELQSYIAQKYPKLQFEANACDLTITVPTSELISFCKTLKTDSNLLFDNLMSLTAVDNLKFLDVVYHVSSYQKKHRLTVKTRVDEKNPEVSSVVGLWPGANWHERETYDLFGVIFKGHPDLRRILLSDDWEGHPMRKNYTHWNLTPLPDEVTQVTKDYPFTPSHTPYGD